MHNSNAEEIRWVFQILVLWNSLSSEIFSTFIHEKHLPRLKQETANSRFSFIVAVDSVNFALT